MKAMKWVALALVLLGLGWMAFTAWQALPSLAPAAQPPAAHRQPAENAAAVAARPAAAIQEVQPPAPRGAEAKPAIVDICGIGPATLTDLTRIVPREVLAEQRALLVRSMLQGEARTRAAGLLLHILDVADQVAVRGIQQQLVQLAHGSPDPRLYGFVVAFACNGRLEGACAELSFEAWAERDTQDALPWWWAGHAARQRGDGAGAAEAWAQAATRPRASDPSLLLTPVALRAAEALQMAPIHQLALMFDTLGIEAGRATPGQLVMACLSQPADPSRQALCEAMVRQGLHASASLTQRGQALRIAKGLGWPEARLQPMREEFERVQRARWRLTGDDRACSCEGLRAQRAMWQGIAERGEMAALSALPAAPGGR